MQVWGYGKTDKVERDDVGLGMDGRVLRERARSSLPVFASLHGIACCCRCMRFMPRCVAKVQLVMGDVVSVCETYHGVPRSGAETECVLAYTETADSVVVSL
jgi:hypothetical protein